MTLYNAAMAWSRVCVGWLRTEVFRPIMSNTSLASIHAVAIIGNHTTATQTSPMTIRGMVMPASARAPALIAFMCFHVAVQRPFMICRLCSTSRVGSTLTRNGLALLACGSPCFSQHT